MREHDKWPETGAMMSKNLLLMDKLKYAMGLCSEVGKKKRPDFWQNHNMNES